jgi:hypothetical protein
MAETVSEIECSRLRTECQKTQKEALNIIESAAKKMTPRWMFISLIATLVAMVVITLTYTFTSVTELKAQGAATNSALDSHIAQATERDKNVDVVLIEIKNALRAQTNEFKLFVGRIPAEVPPAWFIARIDRMEKDFDERIKRIEVVLEKLAEKK